MLDVKLRAIFRKLYLKESIQLRAMLHSLLNKLFAVYLKLSWTGNVSSKFDNEIDKAITSCFYAVKPRAVYNTRVMLPSAKKDIVPTTQKSCVVYEFSCRCEARYVGRTTQRLADRIKQHVPTSIRTKNTTTREQPPRMCKNSNSKMKSDSAIGQHLITNPECAKTYTYDIFRIIGQARSSFHLGVLESVSGYIFRFTFRSLSGISYSDECRKKKAFNKL